MYLQSALTPLLYISVIPNMADTNKEKAVPLAFNVELSQA